MTLDRREQILDSLTAPLGDLIAEVGRSVAEAQQAMDAGTIRNVIALVDAAEPDDPLRLLRQIGYQPTWYQIPEVTAEITVALTLSGSEQTSNSGQPTMGLPARRRMVAAPVDATYTSRFNFDLKAASSLKFRIVPVPPSPAAERMRVIPKLVGLTFAEARTRLAELGIKWQLPEGAKTEPKETTPVSSQAPAPGEVLTSGAVQIGFDG